MDRISNGDLPKKITDNYNGDFNEIKNNLNNCIDNINALTTDVNQLVKSAIDGKLDTRADAIKHMGDYRKIVEGVNATLDSVIGPLNVAAEYVDRISKGDIPKKITDTYNGDFNEIKNNLNNCIDGLGGLTEANAVLQKMANNDYTTNVEGSYQGVYADVGKAVNTVEVRIRHVTETVNRVANGDIAELKDYQKIGRRSEKDQLLPALTKMMEAIERLIEDTTMLSKAADEGKLKTRADASKHTGDYRKVVEGVNATLDSVIEPVNEALRVSKGYATQDFTIRVDHNLKVPGY